MSSKRDWNDMSDSDADSSDREQIPQTQGEQQGSKTEQIPSLNKIVSSPLPDKKSSNEQQNLLKLQNCPKQQVWLYAPLFYKESIDEVDKIIRNEPNIKRVEQFVKGWNVLTSRQQAKVYIVEGKREGKFFIKFYFSNKNQQNNQNHNHKKGENYRNDYDNKKVKYMPKSPNGKADFKNNRSPDSLRRIESQQESAGGKTPKSPNYKKQEWRKYDDDSRGYRQKNYNNPNYRQANEKAERQDSDSLGKEKANYNNKGYKPKYTTKQPYKQDSQYAPESPKKKYVQKQQEQTKTQTQKAPPKPEQKEAITPVKEQPQQKKPQAEQTQDLEEQERGSPNEKKGKKKNKKKNDFIKDANNPFSMLKGI